MSTQVRGIAAQYAGKCDSCGARYEVGDLIDKLASGKRGHAICAANEKDGRQSQAPVGDQQPAAQSAPVTTGAVANNGHSNRHAAPSGFMLDPTVITALWQFRNALTQIAQGAMAGAVAVEMIASYVDPHRSKVPRTDRP